MKYIKVISSAERADWVVRNPEEFYAFCRWEANRAANNKTATVHEWRQSLMAARTIHDSLWVRIMRRLMR